MSDGDAIGGLVTGSLAAHEMSKSGARHPVHAGEKHDICLNCGTPAPGHYCPECGQHAHVARSIGHILHELAHAVLHLDGKFWRTLPMLIARPGQLTRDYVEGKRARYVAPFGIFLFTVFAMYFIFAFIGAPGGMIPVADVEGSAAARAEMQAELAAVNARLTDLYDRREAAAAAGETAAVNAIDSEIDDAELERSIVSRTYDTVTTGSFDLQDQLGETFEQVRAERARQAASGEAPAADRVTGVGWLDDKFDEVTANPELYFYKIKQSAYKYSFLLLPLSLPFVWLLFFWRRDLHLYDHTVFILYSLSFISLLTMLMWIGMAAGIWGWMVFWSAMVFIPPIHMYKQLKYAYGLSRAGALLRTFVLCNFALVVLAAFVMIVAALGAL